MDKEPLPTHRIDILLVDDRVENLSTLETVLESEEYHLIKANSGEEALRYLLDHEPALILMDVQMPKMDGFETATLIKQSDRTRDIPIIFVTAINKDERYVHQGYNHGAVDYIYKPYDAHILRSKVSVFADLAKKNQRLLEIEKRLRQTERRDREQQIVQLELKGLRREQGEQKKYLDLVEGISHGIVWSAHPESLAVSFVSPSAENIGGYPLERWSEEESFLLNHLPAADRNLFLEKVKELTTIKKNVEFEHRFQTKSGKEIWLHTGLRLGQSPDESAPEIRALSVDITKLKQAEATMLMLKKRSDFLAEASLLLSESLDYEDTLERVSKLAVPRLADWIAIHILDEEEQLKLLNVNHRDAAKVKRIQELLTQYPPRAGAQSGVMKVLETGKPVFHPQMSEEIVKMVAHDETHLKALMSFGIYSTLMVPLTAHGKTFGVMSLFSAESKYEYNENDLAIAEDLARRAAIAIDNAHFYQQAQAAIRVRDEFLSVASHELKTPLTPLKLQTQLLMRSLSLGTFAEIKPEKIDKILQISNRQLDRLSLLVDELLDISRISNGKLTLNLEPFNLVDLVRDILDRFSGQTNAANCDVSFHSPCESLAVTWDHFRIEQVIINLLTNAVKYGPAKPIELRAWQEKELIHVSVKDHGMGVAKKDQRRIFDRFERAVGGNHISGLGLGLYIVTKALEAHGGKIEIESEPDVGSTFTFSIPVQVSDLPEVKLPGIETASATQPLH